MSNKQAHIEAVNFIIQNRSSVFPKDYIQKPIEKEIILQILQNADRAPTHKLTQPWRFKVLTSLESRLKLGNFLAETYKQQTPLAVFLQNKYEDVIQKSAKSQAVIVLNMQRDLSNKLPEWEEIAAVAMAVQNMYLTCQAYSIGCYWGSATGLREFVPQFFAMQPGECNLGFLYMGYYQNTPTLSKRTALESKVEWL